MKIMNFRLMIMSCFALVATACGSVPAATMAAAPALQAESAAVAPAASPIIDAKDYRLGVADRVRILIYNEPTLSGEFVVNSNGAIAVPLIGDVVATSKTATELSSEITARLSQGYLRDPRVSIDVVNFRPFYILGEVNKPGEYPYSNGLTVLNAVATAQGFTYRADKRRVYIKSAGKEAEEALRLSSAVEVKPGDTIRIGERIF